MKEIFKLMKKCVRLVWALVCLAVMSVWYIVGVITSPLWYTIWLVLSPQNAAKYLCAKRSTTGIEKVHKFIQVSVQDIACHVMRKLWPTAIMPMKYRRYFIDYDNMPLSIYSLDTQVKYFLSLSQDEKLALLNKPDTSHKLKDTLWDISNRWGDYTERKYFLLAEIHLSNTKIQQFIVQYGSSLYPNKLYMEALEKYFIRYTPNEDTVRFIFDNYSRHFQGILLDFIKKQKPTPEIFKLYMSSDVLREKAAEIMDGYLDIEAVQQTLNDLNNAGEEEKKKVLGRWRTYCESKESMALGAQKNLTFELYKIFVESGCHLSVRGVYALCRQLTEHDTEFLREILQNEFQLINAEILSVLKMSYWKYSVYLDVKKTQN